MRGIGKMICFVDKERFFIQMEIYRWGPGMKVTCKVKVL